MCRETVMAIFITASCMVLIVPTKATGTPAIMSLNVRWEECRGTFQPQRRGNIKRFDILHQLLLQSKRGSMGFYKCSSNLTLVLSKK